MSEAAKTLMQAVLELPEAERAEFVRVLVDSLPKPPRMMSEDDPNFDAEIARRLAEYRAGRSKPIPGKEFFRRLREKLT